MKRTTRDSAAFYQKVNLKARGAPGRRKKSYAGSLPGRSEKKREGILTWKVLRRKKRGRCKRKILERKVWRRKTKITITRRNRIKSVSLEEEKRKGSKSEISRPKDVSRTCLKAKNALKKDEEQKKEKKDGGVFGRGIIILKERVRKYSFSGGRRVREALLKR